MSIELFSPPVPMSETLREPSTPLTAQAPEHLPLAHSEAHPEPAEPPGPHMKVVSWIHIPGNTEVAAESVQDCEVVAIEAAGFRSDRQRAKYDAAATVFVSSTATERQRNRAERYLKGLSSKSMLPLFKRLQGTDKRIVTFDMNRGAPEQADTEKALQLEKRAVNHVHRAPSSKIKSLVLGAAHHYARSNVGRESRDVAQLEDLARQYEGQNVGIGVLVGAYHTPIYHELSKRRPTERRYATGRYAGQQPGERMYVPPAAQLMRHYRFLPGVEVPEGVADRAVLHATRVAAAQKGVEASPKDHSRLLENLTNTEASELVIALDGMKSGVLAKLRPKRTLAKMDATVEAKLAEVAARKNRPARDASHRQ